MASPRKIAIITGAGSGIGRACTVALLAADWTVVVAGRRVEALRATISESGVSEDRSLVIACDVTKPADVQNLFAQTKQKFGRLDLLFNNAGINAPGVPLEELPIERWRDVIDTNLTGAFLCTQEAFRLMKNQEPRGGRIINNGSISAHVPRPNSAAYTAAKHAITGLTKSTALDGRAFNIACGQIDIGNAETPLSSRMKKGVLQANGTIASEAMFDVQHVAAAVLHMANLPLDVNVLSMTIMATGMPFVGRG
jgi:NAD(P)-dependent dehydrogenase (short-subunit alcohol dehydrogenase family)